MRILVKRNVAPQHPTPHTPSPIHPIQTAAVHLYLWINITIIYITPFIVKNSSEIEFEMFNF